MILVFLLTFVAVTLGIFGLYWLVMDLFFQSRPQLRQWLDTELRERQRRRAQESLLVLKHTALTAAPGPAAEGVRGPGVVRRLEVLLEQAGLFLTPAQLVALSVLGGVLAGVAAGVVLGLVLGVATGLAAVLAPFLWVLVRRRRRQEETLRQLPRAFELMARVIRAGHSVPQALEAVVTEVDPPLATEFAYCQEQQRLGLLPEISFRELAQRSEVMELKIFVLAMLVQQKTGGNLTEMLDRLATLIRERVRVRGLVRTLTAEGRLQALFLILLPPLLFLIMLAIHRSYAQVLLEHYELLLVAGGSMALGAAWIHRIVRFDF